MGGNLINYKNIIYIFFYCVPSGIFVAIHCMSQNYNFSFMPKIIRILRSCSIKICCTVNISKRNY